MKNIHLPADARFIAGFVHEKNSLDQNRRIRDIIEDGRGGLVDIACTCGLGRRTPEIAMQLMGFMSELTE